MGTCTTALYLFEISLAFVAGTIAAVVGNPGGVYRRSLFH